MSLYLCALWIIFLVLIDLGGEGGQVLCNDIEGKAAGGHQMAGQRQRVLTRDDIVQDILGLRTSSLMTIRCRVCFSFLVGGQDSADTPNTSILSFQCSLQCSLQFRHDDALIDLGSNSSLFLPPAPLACHFTW